MSTMRSSVICMLAVALGATEASAQKPFQSSVRAEMETALGRGGTPNPGGVLRFGFPRSDLRVVANGVTLNPAFALGSWVAFQRVGDHAMVMGDLVLLETEVESVMASLQENGVTQTALHNHLLGESPRVMYMHIRADGNPARIARAIRAALEFSGTPFGPPPTPPAGAPPAAPTSFDLDTAGIAGALR